MSTAVDSDVLIYSVDDSNPLGRRLTNYLETHKLIGSNLLLPETQIKPVRNNDITQLDALDDLVKRVALFPVEQIVAIRAVGFGAQYGLQTVDAIHLATAVHHGADSFLTNNKKDFPKSIVEIEILYPEDLPEPV